MPDISDQPAKRAAVAREGEQHMNRLADRVGDLGDDARSWAQQYRDLAEHGQSSSPR